MRQEFCSVSDLLVRIQNASPPKKNPPALAEGTGGGGVPRIVRTSLYCFLTGVVGAVVVVPVFAAEAVLVLFFVELFFVGLVALLAAAGLAATLLLAGAWAANIRGMEATANAIVANNVFFIFFSPCGLNSRLQFYIDPESPELR